VIRPAFHYCGCSIFYNSTRSPDFNEKMYRRYFFLGVILLFLSVTLFACDPISNQPEEDSILIGVALPETGTLGGAGQSVARGVRLAVNEHAAISGLTTALAFKNTKSTAEGAAQAYRELASFGNLPVVIGPITSTATEAVIPVVNENNIVSIGPTSSKAGLSAQGDYLFRSSLTVERIVPPGVQTAKENLQFRNVATLHNAGDAFSISSNDLVTEELRKYNDVNIVIEESYSRPPGTVISGADIAGPLDNILSATPVVDAIFLSALPEDQTAILPTAYRRGNDAPFVAPFLSIAEVKTINRIEPGAAERAVTFTVWLAGSPNELSRTFVRDYMQTYGVIPDDWAARGYASTVILLEALQRASRYDSNSIREALSGIDNFPTIFGGFSFDDDGDAVYDPAVAVVRDNDFVTWPVKGKQ
jgi:branched-chain amino acid transport system substrate-binding protein